MSIKYLITTKTITRICWLVINLTYLATALKDVRVAVPRTVKRGDNAALSCHYDLQNDTLYSVKWYKGRREFYRYTPRENHPMKVFSSPGINVERSMSNESNLLLTSVGPTVSGKYSCEVSADAPSFDTVIISGDLEVLDIPESGPTIEGVDKVYSIGDILETNCTLRSNPAANLTWLINNFTVSSHQIKTYLIVKDGDLESITLGLKLVITTKHFRSSKIKLSCLARIYDIYEQVSEKIIDLDETTNLIIFDDHSSTIENSKHSRYESELDENNNDIKMHQVDMSSSASTSSSSSHSVWSKTLSNSKGEHVLYHLGVSLITLFVRILTYSPIRLNESL